MATKESTRDRVREMVERGLSPREMATLTGVSIQRIYQILTDERKRDDRAV